MSEESEALDLVRSVATLYALLILIDEIAEKAQKNGGYFEIDAALAQIREMIKTIK